MQRTVVATTTRRRGEVAATNNHENANRWNRKHIWFVSGGILMYTHKYGEGKVLADFRLFREKLI